MEALRLLNAFGIVPWGILHVGASDGQEFGAAYRASHAQTVVYVEPISAVYATLKARVEETQGHFAVKALCSAVRRRKWVRWGIIICRGVFLGRGMMSGVRRKMP